MPTDKKNEVTRNFPLFGDLQIAGFYIATGRTAHKYTILGSDSLQRINVCTDYQRGNEVDKDSMTVSKANYGR